jgi:hypothetical protein
MQSVQQQRQQLPTHVIESDAMQQHLAGSHDTYLDSGQRQIGNAKKHVFCALTFIHSTTPLRLSTII